MSDQGDHEDGRPVSKRGEAAWKEAKERVAERNEQARKAGKQQAYERQRDEARRAADLRRRADLLGQPDTR